MSRPTLKNHMKERVKTKKQNLISTLYQVDYIATTTDCWSASRKSFIGMTAHWIDSDFKRQSAALACKRLKGPHTYDVLAGAIEDIHCGYEIRAKVTKTTTDNGSNFIKAFSRYQENAQSEQQSANLDSATDNTEDDIENANDDCDSTFADIQFADTHDILNEATCFNYVLPPHQRCACHTLHLIATKDVLKAEFSFCFKKLHRACFGKLTSLWNKCGSSTNAA